jgi:hypothetical protein
MLIFAVIIGISAISRLATQRKQKRHLERQEDLRRRPAQPAGPQVSARTVQQRPAVQRESQPRPSMQRQGQASPSMQSETRPGPGVEQQPQQEPAGRAKPRTIIRPGSALSAFVAEIKQEIQRAAQEMQGAPPATPAPAAKPQAPKPAKLPKPVGEAVQPKPSVLRRTAHEELGTWPVRLPELSGPEDLKRAILYYEILGKPVSMRGPGDQLIGL